MEFARRTSAGASQLAGRVGRGARCGSGIHIADCTCRSAALQMWVLPKGLSPTTVAGTNAIFFAVINWLKVPAYVALGQFTQTNMTAAAILMPVAIATTFAGVWLIRRVKAERFYTFIYLLMIAVGAQLLWRALSG